VGLIFGVRPNSVVTHDERGLEHAAAVEVADQGGERLVDRRELAFDAGFSMLSWWSQPPAVRETKRTPTSIEPAGEEHPLAGLDCGRTRP
jgi:hypothetical protein